MGTLSSDEPTKNKSDIARPAPSQRTPHPPRHKLAHQVCRTSYSQSHNPGTTPPQQVSAVVRNRSQLWLSPQPRENRRHTSHHATLPTFSIVKPSRRSIVSSWRRQLRSEKQAQMFRRSFFDDVNVRNPQLGVHLVRIILYLVIAYTLHFFLQPLTHSSTLHPSSCVVVQNEANKTDKMHPTYMYWKDASNNGKQWVCAEYVGAGDETRPTLT